MPVWHEAAKKWAEEGRVELLAVIQEQHPERCELFAQWHQIDWPILHDPINVLQATGVPMFIAIDEHGIVRSTRARIDDFEASFLDRDFSDDAATAKPQSLTPPRTAPPAPASGSPETRAAAWRTRGDSLTIWHRDQLNEAIAAYESALRLAPDDLDSSFRLGVCLRTRHESESRQSGDFARAIAAWEAALAGNPGQYIWRRRIQQFGPRLTKPYPFYDWVTTAERDIRHRGEQPRALRVRPSGAEVASPAQELQVDSTASSSPDPDGRIPADHQQLIDTFVATVPTRVAAGSTARVHVTFVPNQQKLAHWNNEAEPLRMWIDPPAGSRVERQLLSAPQPPAPESQEVRHLDVEIEVPKEASETLKLTAYALYYVCEDIDGACQFLRQEIPIEIAVAASE